MMTNPRVKLTLYVVAVLAAAGMVVAIFRPAGRNGEPPPLRVVSGTFSEVALDGTTRALGGFVPVGKVVTTGPEDRNVLELPEGVSLRVGKDTRFSIAADGEARLDTGRIWLTAPPTAAATVTSFNMEATLRDGSAEVVSWLDKDHFKNTVVRAWKGTTTVLGGPRLLGSAQLTYGQAVRIDDVDMHPVATFDATTPDTWQRWNLDAVNLPR